MKRVSFMRKSILIILCILGVLSLSCSLGGIISGDELPTPDDTTSQIPMNVESPKEEPTQVLAETPADTEVTPTVGVVYAEISLDRTPGNGDCGIDPWFTPDCPMGIRIWWELHMKAVATTPVLIIPDGQERWVITNHSEVTGNYDLDINSFADRGGKYTEININPAATNPECVASIQGLNFDLQVMGERQEGLTNIIISANPIEKTQGSCMEAEFNWETSWLQYGWAAALSGDPYDLSFEMNDTFKIAPGHYHFEIDIDTNPSPENRDHVSTILEFMCVGSEPASTLAPISCPWE